MIEEAAEQQKGIAAGKRVRDEIYPADSVFGRAAQQHAYVVPPATSTTSSSDALDN